MQSKEEGKDQESIQSSTTPGLGHHIKSRFALNTLESGTRVIKNNFTFCTNMRCGFLCEPCSGDWSFGYLHRMS